MPLYPETFEDLELIYTKLNPKSGDEEDLLDDLSSASDALSTLECELRSASGEASEGAQEVAGFCEELVELTRELSERVKYDPELAIFLDEFAGYSWSAAALAVELEEYAAELDLYGDVAACCRDEVDELRRLVKEYGADLHEDCNHGPYEYCEKYGSDWPGECDYRRKNDENECCDRSVVEDWGDED